MRTILRNASVVIPSGPTLLDVEITGERVSALVDPGQAHAGDIEEDLSGLLVFPGFIDPHVHSRDPGMTHKEDFEHSTLAAASGGVTTILEMPNSIPPVTNAAELRARAIYYRQRSWVDFGLWGLALGAQNKESIRGLFEAGAVGVKLFWGYYLDSRTLQLIYNPTGTDGDAIPPPDAGEIMGVADEVAAAGGLLALHCEDRAVLAAAARNASLKPGYEALLASRPVAAEAISVATAAEIAHSTNCHVHVVHLSSGRGAQIIQEAQSLGYPISAETCPHYLTLDSESPPVAAGLVKVYPPIRERAHREQLWDALRSGVIASVGSDHAPHSSVESALPLADRPAGMTGIETMGPVMVDAMCRGAITPELLASVLSRSTAKIYGIYPRKGELMPGSDADLTVVDPGGSTTIDNAILHSLNPYSPWHGQSLKGRIVRSYLRGQALVTDGRVQGPMYGDFIPASHSPMSMPARAT